MNFSTLAAARYSVRRYETTKVEPEKLRLILEAARLAPSACNNKPVRLIVVQQDEGLSLIRGAARAHNAPLVIIACGDTAAAATREIDGKHFTDIDTSIVLDHMMLQACDLGLGTCWIGAFDPKEISRVFHLDASLEPIGLMEIGYAAAEPLTDEQREKRRKTLDELVAYETF